MYFLIVCAYFDKYTRYQKSPFMINNLKSTNMLISDLSLHKNHLFFVLKAKKFFFYYFSFFCVLFYVFCAYFEKYDIYQKSVLMKMYQNQCVLPICTTYMHKKNKNCITLFFWPFKTKTEFFRSSYVVHMGETRLF